MHTCWTIITLITLPLLSGCQTSTTGLSTKSEQGRTIYAQECSQCHGANGEGAGPASLGLGSPAPNLNMIAQRNDGAFPREFIRRFVLGRLEKSDPNAAMPDFSTQGFQHVGRKGSANVKVSEADFEALLDYLETLQR